MRIYLHHLVVQIAVIADHHFGVPSSRHEDRINTTAQGCGKDVANLQADEESKGYDNDRVLAVRVIGRVGELKVQVRKQSGGETDKGGTEGEDWTNQTLVDKGVDAAIFDQSMKS